MVGRVKVGVSSDSTQTTRTTAWVERESTQDKKSQRLLKLLTGFCIGQAIIVVASVVVLAILLNSNTKEINMLKQNSDVLLNKINLHATNLGSLVPDHSHRAYIDASISAIETNINADLLAIISRLSLLEEETTTEKQVHATRIALLEAHTADLNESIQITTQEYEARLTKLEIDKTDINDTVLAVIQNINNGTIQQQTAENTTKDGDLTLMDKITQLEAESMVDQEQILFLNSTMTQLILDIQSNEVAIQAAHSTLVHVELQRTLDIADIKHINDSISELHSAKNMTTAYIQDLSANMTKLEFEKMFNRADIRDLNSSVTTLEHGRILSQNDVGKLNASISKLEIEQTRVEVELQNLNFSIASLDNFRVSERKIIGSQNDSILRLKMNVAVNADNIYNNTLVLMQVNDAMEMNGNSIRNLTSKIFVMDANRQTDMTEIEINGERLSQLDLRMNETQDFRQNFDKRLSYLEDSLNCTWGEWTTYSYCSADGTQYRERTCESLNPNFTGMWCSRKDIDIQRCIPELVLQVGFTVTDPVWTNSSSGIVLQFSTVVTNAMGGFDLSTGEFTCEYPGLYLFTMTIVRDSNFWEMFWCCFYVNGIDTGIEADAYGNDFGYPWATNVLVTHLKQGDTVYLQCYDAQYMCYATFSGVLIQADNTP